MEPFRPKLIVVPTDFSEPAAHALRYASALGERFDAHLLIIYADPFIPPVDFSGMTAAGFAVHREDLIEEAREELEAHVQQNVSEHVPYDARAPAEQIVEFAKLKNAELIAIGVPAGRSIGDALYGTIVEQIVQRSACPVLTVNERTAQRIAPEIGRGAQRAPALPI